jgi:hypothetical protein
MSPDGVPDRIDLVTLIISMSIRKGELLQRLAKRQPLTHLIKPFRST